VGTWWLVVSETVIFAEVRKRGDIVESEQDNCGSKERVADGNNLQQISSRLSGERSAIRFS
jgi:hypothetical protein